MTIWNSTVFKDEMRWLKTKALSLGLKCERCPVHEPLFAAVTRNIEEEAGGGGGVIRGEGGGEQWRLGCSRFTDARFQALEARVCARRSGGRIYWECLPQRMLLKYTRFQMI